MEVKRFMRSSVTGRLKSSESWLSSDGRQLEDKHLIELWKQCSVDVVANLDLHFKYANWYSAFFIALLAAYVVGLSQYYKSFGAVLFLTLPLLVIVLAQLGKYAMDRFYQTFLETVTVLAKLEKLLGLDGTIGTKSCAKSATALWPEDKQLIPYRYFKSRYDPNVVSSEEFIKRSLKLGANKTVHDTFLAFQITAVLLFLGGIALFALFQTCMQLT